MYKVLIPMGCAQAALDWLRERGYQADPLQDFSVENICRVVGDYDAIIARSNLYPRQVFEAAPKLKVIARTGVGVDNVDLDAAADHGVVVTNTPGLNAGAVAEHTLALMLACARNLPVMDKAARAGDFGIRNRLNGHDVAGKTLGIVGYGDIGAAVARKAALGLDMKVLGYSRRIGQMTLPDYVQPATLDTILRTADYVSLHVPGTPATHHMIGAAQLAKMKPGAVLLNLARGSVVDSEALYQALKNGTIAGAGLDVYEQEPPAVEDPLFGLDNVVFTPHNAALTVETAEKMALGAAACLDAVLHGQPTTTVSRKK